MRLFASGGVRGAILAIRTTDWVMRSCRINHDHSFVKAFGVFWVKPKIGKTTWMVRVVPYGS